MSDRFFGHPILNSPYEYPSRHWELDDSGQPTSSILASRRRVSFITPIPKPKKRGQREMDFDEAAQALETDGQQYQLMEIINALRRQVDGWRAIPDPARWRVTPETARLLQHWRNHRFNDIRPFFCQVEAAESRDLADRGRATRSETKAAASSTTSPRPTSRRTPASHASR